MFAKGALTMAGDVIKLLEEKMWEGVAAKAVAHLAKYSVRNESANCLDQFLGFTFDRDNEVPHINPYPYPKAIPKDEWAVLYVTVYERPSIEAAKRTMTINTNNSNNRKNLRKASDQPSIVEKAIKADPFVRVYPEPEVTPEEDKLRWNYLTYERLKVQAEVDRVKRYYFYKKQYYMKGKMSKDKNITFDYNGKVINLGNDKTQKKPLLSTMGLNIPKDSEITKKVEKRKIESYTIERGFQTTNAISSKQRSTNKSDAELLSKVEVEESGQKTIVEDESLIEKGVKVIELQGDKQTIKQNKAKYDQNFLKYRLKYFKDYIRERKFKYYALKIKDIQERPQRQSVPIVNSEQIIDKKPQQPNNVEEKRKKDTSISMNITQKDDSQVFLPEISLKPNERSSKYFEEIGKDKNKNRVKSVKIDNYHILSSFYYKNIRNSSRKKMYSGHKPESTININEKVYSYVFDMN